MTKKVVAREDVVHLEAIGAGVALADVALEKTLAVDDTPALAVGEAALRRGLAAGLAG
jgi:hypothetical protein